MSSAIRLASRASLAVLVAAGAAACVDPAKRLDEFSERVVDAAPRADGAGVLADISGEALLAISPSFMPEKLIRFITTATYAPDAVGATIDLTIQPVIEDACCDTSDACDPGDGGNPIGDAIAIEDIAVSADGGFTFELTDATVVGEANPISCSDIVADFELFGIIRSTDLVCGDVDGMVKSPLAVGLAGSTFAAVRIEPGTVGDANLPAPVAECPE